MSSIRTYFCIYLFSSSITLMFASPPVVTTVDARGLSLPCSTDDWSAKINALTWVPPETCLYDDAMVALWSGKSLQCSAFGVRILATSVFLEIWQAQHGHGSWLPENWKERHYIVLDFLQKHINTSWNVRSLHHTANSRLFQRMAIPLFGMLVFCYMDVMHDLRRKQRMSKKPFITVTDQHYLKV